MKKRIIIIFVAICFVVGTIGASYALFSTVTSQEFSNVFRSQCLKIDFEESSNISLKSAIPITDESGMKSDPYSFSFTNTCSNMISYTIALEVFNTSTLSEEYVKVALTDLNEPKLLNSFETTEVTQKNAKTSYILEAGVMSSNEEINRNLRMWMDYNTTKEQGANRNFTAKIIITIEPELYTCQKARIENFADCLIATQYNASAEMVGESKQKIISRGTPDFSKTSPAILYEKVLSNNIVNHFIEAAYVSTNYSFDINTGMYTLLNYERVSPNDVSLEKYKGYYLTDGGHYVNSTMYKVESIISDGAYLRITGYKYTQNTLDISINDGGLYAAEDDYTKDTNNYSYYYRGVVKNNNVTFAGYNWKVVRINGDGSIKLINTDSTLTSKFNDFKDKPIYVGYMYGDVNGTTYEEVFANTNDSTLKTVLENWYENNLLNYASYINDTLFCNDRSTVLGDVTNPNVLTHFGGYYRLHENKLPTLKCSRIEDAFTVDDEVYGNGSLKYPIALITADELSMAGGVYLQSNSSYYLSNKEILTLTPRRYSLQVNAQLLAGDTSGNLSAKLSNSNCKIYPVINLKSTVKVTAGTGTENDPYTIAI